MSEAPLTAVVRTEFGKGAARRARRAGTTPAVLYGAGSAPVHLALPTHDVFVQIKGKANPVLTLVVEGSEELALVKDVQRDPVRQEIEHLDLVRIRRGEQVSVEVPIVVSGELPAGKVLVQDLHAVKVLTDAARIPAHIEVVAEDLTGEVLRAGDLALPAGVVLEEDPEAVVLTLANPEAETEAETEETEPESTEA